MTKSKELVSYSWKPLSPEASTFSPFTHAQRRTRTSRTFYTFALPQPTHQQKNSSMGRGRGKGNPKKDPKTGGRADRKVVLEYSSDEDENNPQPAEGAEAPKRVKKRIHLTLPTSPAHVTTTKTFATFFINHGLTRALQKAFAGRGWNTDQMREFIANFQKKHGQQVPMPKIYGDEDSSDDEGPELADGTKAGRKKTTASARGGDSPSRSGGSVGGSGGRK